MRGVLFRRLLFPPKCVGCGMLTDWHARECALCEKCTQLWEKGSGVRCGICGEPVTRCLCVTETMRAAKCQGFYKLCFYRPAAREQLQSRMIYHIKEHTNAEAFAFLAERLLPAVERIRERDPEAVYCITYLPRSKQARRAYGLDQAERLARALAQKSGIPCERLLLRSGGRTQKELSPAARIKNAREAFALAPRADCKGKTLLLVDDIVTTGAGMAVGARLLRRGGAKAVYCLGVASDEVNREMT